jgi:indole-3-glycerol phosphate synthase
VDLALEYSWQLVGLNNYDLRYFTADLATIERLAPGQRA